MPTPSVRHLSAKAWIVQRGADLSRTGSAWGTGRQSLIGPVLLCLRGERLLAECERRGIEGIVSKRKDAPYRSGKGDWMKVKTRAWREANRDRGELFSQRKEGPRVLAPEPK